MSFFKAAPKLEVFIKQNKNLILCSHLLFQSDPYSIVVEQKA